MLLEANTLYVLDCSLAKGSTFVNREDTTPVQILIPQFYRRFITNFFKADEDKYIKRDKAPWL